MSKRVVVFVLVESVLKKLKQRLELSRSLYMVINETDQAMMVDRMIVKGMLIELFRTQQLRNC